MSRQPSRPSSSKPRAFPQAQNRDLKLGPQRSLLQPDMPIDRPKRSSSHPTPLEDTMRSEDESDLETRPLTLSQHGPFIGPSSPQWRRERLLMIGSSSESNRVPAPQEPTAATLLTHSSGDLNSYGSVPSPTRLRQNGDTATRRALTVLSGLPHGGSSSILLSPRSPRLRSSSFFTLRRPVTAYDAPMEDKVDSDDENNDEAARANGIRVW